MRKGYHLIGAHAQRLPLYWCAFAKVIFSLVRMRKGYLLIGAHAQGLHLIGAHAKGLYLIGAHALKVFISLVGWLAGEMPLEMWQVYCTVYQAGLFCWMKTYTLKQLQKIPLFEKVEKLALNIYLCTYIFAFENHQNTFNEINHCPLYPIFFYIFCYDPAYCTMYIRVLN